MQKLILKKYSNNYSTDCIEINTIYFESLLKKYRKNELIDLVMFDGSNDSNVIPLPIATKADLKHISICDYEALEDVISSKLQDYTLNICKMQAGLGTSVERLDLLEKYSDRKTLGSKGTDLFVEYEGKMLSIAEIQLLYAEKKLEQKEIGKIKFVNLVNSETAYAVDALWDKKHPFKNLMYKEVFNTERLHREENIYQLMMPTINNNGDLSFDREAPAGHAFLGFYQLVKLFRLDNAPNEITCIGNGEDLKSNPDPKILSWIVENDIPIVMVTTTKLDKDKKGGQLAIVHADAPYVTIVEKAQAEKANQLDYFQELGLRENDQRSLFNTNIVLINKKALKDIFNRCLSVDEAKFLEILTPDLIKNIKEQDGQEFIQLEGAIGSTLLNLDKYFREEFKKPVVHFLNLSPENREDFFLPIKTRQDFEDIYIKS